jgi:hypothetical protein
LRWTGSGSGGRPGGPGHTTPVGEAARDAYLGSILGGLCAWAGQRPLPPLGTIGEVAQDLLNDRSLVNEGDGPHGAATLGAEQGSAS